MRDIFVPLFQQTDHCPQLDAAARLASRLGAQVNVVLIRSDAVMAAARVPDMLAAAGVILNAIENDDKIARQSALAQFEKWRIANGLTGSVGRDDGIDAGATWHERVGPVARTVTEVGRLSDLIVIAPPDPYAVMTDDVFTAAIYASGRPTLIAPERIVDDPLEHILIAWNGSLQAARAVDGAMPLLKKAARVSIFSVPVLPEELFHDLGLIDHLARHGISAECLRPDMETNDVGTLLLETAAEEDATLIVMGAYTHSRVREAVLGGVTQSVLKHAKIPVLMMH